MTDQPVDHRRSRWSAMAMVATGWLLVLVFVLLGNWQIERRAWKLDLIERVNARAFGEAFALPPANARLEDFEYQRVRVSGTFDHQRSALVKAVTELGPGYWVMTVLNTDRAAIWINRGFIPQAMKDAKSWTKQVGGTEIIGLLRLDEPGGTFLESNAPLQDRWVSRDVKALSAKFGVPAGVTYFIDQQTPNNRNDWPRAGLTLIKFRNPHLVYALTWFALAAFLAGALIWLHKDLLKQR